MILDSFNLLPEDCSEEKARSVTRLPERCFAWLVLCLTNALHGGVDRARKLAGWIRPRKLLNCRRSSSQHFGRAVGSYQRGVVRQMFFHLNPLRGLKHTEILFLEPDEYARLGTPQASWISCWLALLCQVVLELSVSSSRQRRGHNTTQRYALRHPFKNELCGVRHKLIEAVPFVIFGLRFHFPLSFTRHPSNGCRVILAPVCRHHSNAHQGLTPWTTRLLSTL